MQRYRQCIRNAALVLFKVRDLIQDNTGMNLIREMLLLALFICAIPGRAEAQDQSSPGAQSTAEKIEHAEKPIEPRCVLRHPQAVRACECFALETLSAEDQAFSRQLLLKALDSEALFTLAGGVKPVSEGFFSTRFRVDPPDTSELERVRRAIAPWRCGTSLEAGVLVFENLHEGERFAAGWIADRNSLESLLAERAGYFGRLGLTKESSGESVMLSIERASQPEERWKGFGLAFGYPEFAIDFFVRAGLHQRETGEFIEREFRQYPTFSRQAGGFVYAVPQVTPEQDCERPIRRNCEAILAEYKHLRALHTDGETVFAERLIRAWYDDGTGWCHPDHAKQRVLGKHSTP